MDGIKLHRMALLLFLGAVSAALANRVKLGGYAGVLDRMGAGVAELGAGNTGTARQESMPAAYWNPAALAFQRQTGIAAGADIRSLNRNGGLLAIQGRVAPNMGMGLAVVNRGDFHIEVYDRNETHLGVARPQDFGFYLGIGVKSSRKNSFGVALQWHYSNKDIGGQGDINTIGIFNLAWYRSWNSVFKTGLVIRNLGLNSSLSASYDLRTGLADNDLGMDRSGSDFLPKTLVAALMYRFTVLERPLDMYFEFLDFLLYDEIFDEQVYDRDHHSMDFRLGADWQVHPSSFIRTGYDRGNICLGFGYGWKIKRGRTLTFDYAVTVERAGLTFNPYAIGIKYQL